jgi:hypothetical protein
MTVTQKARLEDNLRLRRRLKEEEDKRNKMKDWDKHHLRKPEDTQDLGLHDPKYVK